MHQAASQATVHIRSRDDSGPVQAQRAEALGRFVESGVLFVLLCTFWGLILFAALTAALR